MFLAAVQKPLSAVTLGDVQPRGAASQATIFGKGGTARMVLLPAAAWRTLQELDPGVPNAPAFRSGAGGRISTVPEWRIVRKAARDAGILADVSPHFLRHAYARFATTSTYTYGKPNGSCERYLGPGRCSVSAIHYVDWSGC